MTTESVPCKRSRKGRIVRSVALSMGATALAWWYMHPAYDAKRATGQESDTLLDEFLPGAEFSGAVSVVIHAPPDEIFRALHAVTLADMPIARGLGELRYLPGRLTGKSAGATPSSEPFMELLRTDSGTIVLAEDADREVVLGSIGKYHDPVDQQFVPLHNAADFTRFAEPDYQKLAMSLRVAGSDPQTGYRLTLEHRTHALSPAARWKFGLYWLAIKPGGNVVSWLMLRAIKRRAEQAWSTKQAWSARPM